MAIKFRNNLRIIDFQEDYFRIRSFLIKLNNPNWSFGRWDSINIGIMSDEASLSKIGVWEDDGDIVALAVYDCELGSSYFLVYNEYSFLKKQMLIYSKDAFRKDGKYRALIDDKDVYFQDIAAKMGFAATDERESDAVYHIDVNTIDYNLPDGFKLTSADKNFELINRTIALPDKKYMENWEHLFLHEYVDLNLKISIIAQNGNAVSHCGMWYDNKLDCAFVEPVGTDEKYRGLGLAKAAVLEGIKRCGLLGAKKAFVGSTQQFYYSIGFRPYSTATWWKEK